MKNRLFRSLGSLFLSIAGLAVCAQATPTVGAPVSTAVPSAGAYQVTTTCQITVGAGDPALIAGGVNLLRVDGASPVILGVMQSSGGGVYTLSYTVSAASIGQAQLQASAAFTGMLRRIESPVGTIQILTPAITQVAPNAGQQGQQGLSVAITGQNTHFAQGTSAATFGSGITVASLTVNSATSATAVVNIASGAATGAGNVTMTTGTEVATLANGFTVTAGTPVLTQVAPNSGQQGQQGLSVAITGQFTHFAQGTSTAVFGSGITVTSLTVNSTTSATAVLNIASGTATGASNVTVTTGTEAATLTGGFTVTAATPALTQVAPNSGQQGQQGLSVAITGVNTHFAQGTSAATFGSGITVASLTVNSTTSATAVLNIAAGAATGASNVTMTTGTEVATLVNGFTVAAPTPVLTQAAPNSGQQGQQGLSVAITGQATHFVQGTTAASFAAGITVASLTVNSSTSATAVLNIAAGAATGAGNVTMTTGPEVATLANGFTVTAGTPVVTQVQPNTGQQGQQGISVAITGQFTHFAQGTTTATFGTGITVASLTVNSTTSATAVLNIAAGAATGASNVTMTTGSEIATLTNGFSVTAGTPVLTQVQPGSGTQGQGVTLTITGQFTHFTSATTATFASGITVVSLTQVSSTVATVAVSIAASAPTGPGNVTMTTGSEVATLANGFTVIAGTPVLTQVQPNTGAQGQQNLSVAITGQFTHFAQGTSVASFGAGVTVNSLTVNSTTSATAIVTISGAATIGTNNVTMTTGSEVATLSNGFSITAAPAITQVIPNSGQQGQTGLSVAITGSNTHFAQGTTVASFGSANLTVSSLTVNSATSATAVLSIAAATSVGNYSVSMTTGSEVATLSNGFSVSALTFPTDVITYHYDNSRSGLNSNESILTPTNVSSGGFGKIAEYTLDGRVDGSALYLNQVAIPGVGTKNVVYAATENDTVYAFDDAGFSGSSATVLWQKSLLQAGETSVPLSDQPCGNINPSGVTGTPVIDRGRNAIYVESVSLTSGNAIVHRLHALSLTTGAELFGGPTTITATSAGTAGFLQNGMVTFDPSTEHARAALAEAGGTIYIAYSGMFGDCNPYSPWVLGYSADTLAQTTSINLAPNNTGGGMWMGGSGPAIDSAGSLYVHTGNGFLTTALPNAGNYVNSAVRLATSGGLAVADYYAPANTVSEDNGDLDFGSSGPLLLPDQTDNNSVVHHLSVSATKDGNIYVLNRDNMGQFNGTTDTSYQMFHAFNNQVLCTAAYFNGTVYFYGTGAQSGVASIQAYTISNALLPTTPPFHGTVSFSRGCPTISSNGATNGIVWAVDDGAGVLYALNATTLVKLYSSPAVTAGAGFVTPTVANGRVYFGTSSTLVVFGLPSS